MNSLNDPTIDEVLEARRFWRQLETAFQRKYTHATPLGNAQISPMPIEALVEFEKERNEVQAAKERYEELEERQANK